MNQTRPGYAAWRAMHDEWYARSSEGLRIVTARDGHAMQDDDPEMVIGAIRFVAERGKR